MVYISGPNLFILAWTSEKSSGRQAGDWHWRTHMNSEKRMQLQ